MAGITKWDGFISSRTDSYPFAIYLHDKLREKGAVVRLAYQKTAGELSQNAHTEGTAQLIHTTPFAVVLLTERGFRASEEGRENQDCFQIRELRHIMKRTDNTQAGADAFKVFCVLLQNEAGRPTIAEFKSQVMRESRRENIALLRWLEDYPSYYFIRNSSDTGSEEFQEDFLELVGEVRSHVRELRDAQKRATRASPGPSHASVVSEGAPQEGQAPPIVHEIAPDFAMLERKYLARAAESWSLGVIGDLGASIGGDSAFKFKPERFVEFSAHQHSRDGSPDQTKTTHPLSHWLFRTQQLPLLLVSEGGGGKTTALTAAACAFAARHEDRCRKQCLKIAGGEWLLTASQQLSANDRADYVPLVMRCADVLEAMGDRCDSQTLVATALQHMRQVAEVGLHDAKVASADRDAFYEHMRRQAYVFMLDGLDELANESAAEALFNAGHTLAENLADAGFRVIFTTRDGYRGRFPATRVVLDKPFESDKLLETFIARFADDTEAQKKLLAAARTLRERGDATNFALRTPLLLNAFCCVASQDDYDPAGRLAEFCERTVDYLLKQRKLPKLAKARRDKAEPVEVVARAILRRYAFAFVSITSDASDSSSGIGVIRQSEDEVAAWLRREAAHLALNKLDVGEAKDVLRELAVGTGLFRLEKDTYTFGNTTMFWEYLAAEEMVARGVALELGDAERLKLPAWRAAVRFAHAISVDSAADGRELEAPLALLDMALAADDKDASWSVAELALQLLAESPPADHLGDRLAPSLAVAVVRATEVFEKFKSQWAAAQRATFTDSYFQIGRREDGDKTCRVVEQLFDTFLRPRRKWIPVAAQGLPDGFQIASSAVSVAEYRRFVNAGPSGDDRWWPMSERNAKVNPRLMVSDPSDGSPASSRRFDSWIKQMDRPGSPVVSITCHEAVAYCLWLTDRLRGKSDGIGLNEVIRLPTDAEWSAMLRWCAKGAAYPWGNDSLDKNRERVNWRGADVDHPSAPGVFAPIGDAGLYDFGSNVSSWTIPEEGGAQWPPAPSKFMPVCGGCWFEFKQDAFETDARPNLESPTHRDVGIGFRLVRAAAKN